MTIYVDIFIHLYISIEYKKRLMKGNIKKKDNLRKQNIFNAYFLQDKLFSGYVILYIIVVVISATCLFCFHNKILQIIGNSYKDLINTLFLI